MECWEERSAIYKGVEKDSRIEDKIQILYIHDLRKKKKKTNLFLLKLKPIKTLKKLVWKKTSEENHLTGRRCVTIWNKYLSYFGLLQSWILIDVQRSFKVARNAGVKFKFYNRYLYRSSAVQSSRKTSYQL